jgi:hypothetical protein
MVAHESNQLGHGPRYVGEFGLLDIQAAAEFTFHGERDFELLELPQRISLETWPEKSKQKFRKKFSM